MIKIIKADFKQMYEDVLGKIDEDMMMRDGKYLTYYENASDFMEHREEVLEGEESFNLYLKGIYHHVNHLGIDEPFIVLDNVLENSSATGGMIYTHENRAEDILSNIALKYAKLSGVINRDETLGLIYKNLNHEMLFKNFNSLLNSKDIGYILFAYVVSALEKESVHSALDDQFIDFEELLFISEPWSNSEKAMIEAAWQIFGGSNLYSVEDDALISKDLMFPAMHSIFSSLDEGNTKVVLEALRMKYL